MAKIKDIQLPPGQEFIDLSTQTVGTGASFAITGIDEMAKIKKRIILHENSVPFVFTRDVLSNVERQWKDGEEMTAVGNVALSFMTGIFDTVMLPIQLVFAPALINVYTVSGKDGGRKIRTITKNKRDIYLRSKRFLKIKNALEV